MVLRSFFAFDSDSLVVDSSSNAAIVGNPIINNSSTPNGTVFTYSSGGGTTVTLDDTGGSRNRFEDDDPGDHVITDGGGIVANGAQVEAESIIELRALNSAGDPVGPIITITVFSQGGNFSDVWGFSSDTALQDGVSYIKTGGSNTGTSRYNSFITCFGPGTLIQTPGGDMAIDKSAAEAADSRPGVGRGLALSRRLARGMDGDLECRGGPGARFVLVLPAA